MPDATDVDLPHENGQRKWTARYCSPSLAYQAFRTLAEARTRPDALVVLDLDAEPYYPLATFPARRAEADEGALYRLHVDLGAALACVMEPETPSVEGRVRYESSEVLDQGVDSSRLDGVQLHDSLLGIGLERDAEAVFLGLKPALDPDYPRRIARWRAWWEAVDRGDVDAVRDLIERGTPVGTVRMYGFSALFAAVRTGDVAMVRILLEHGADPNRLNMGGCTPVTFAAGHASQPGRDAAAEILRLLLAAGGRLGLREAVMLGDVDLARSILDAEPTIDVSGDAGCHHSYPFLMIAAEFGRRDVAELLLDRGADVHGTDDDIHHTALCVAASGGYADIVALLLERGADPNHLSDFAFTPLAYAAEHGHADVVRLLLGRGVRRTLADAVFMNDAKLVAELLATAEIERRYIDPILFSRRSHLARCDVDVLRLLLDAWSESGGWLLDEKLLSEAAAAGRRDVVQLLLEHGSDPGKPDGDGVTPAEHAERAGHAEVAELLRAAAQTFNPDDSNPFRR